MHRPRDLPHSLDLLRGFEAAARHLSFTVAAAELFVTQSAVSRQVQALEDQLGVKLFERRTRALALTEAGEQYYREVTGALDRLRAATSGVRGAREAMVRVTATLSFASLWLAPRLARSQAGLENVSVHLTAENVMRDLQRDPVDVAVRYTTAEGAGDGAHMLFGEHVAPVCSPALAAAHRAPFDAAELARIPLLHYQDPGMATPWLAWSSWFEAMKVEMPARSRRLTFSHYDQLLQMAVAGHGVALGRFPLVQGLVREGRLVMPLSNRQPPLSPTRAYWLLVSTRAHGSPGTAKFVQWLRAEAANTRHN